MNKNTIKITNRLLDVLAEMNLIRLRHISTNYMSFCERYSELQKDSRLLSVAVDRDWGDAAKSITERMTRNLNEFSHQLQTLKSFVSQKEIAAPVFPDVSAELVQVEQEFGKTEFDSKNNTLSVETENVVLKDIDLGPFKIELDLNGFSQFYKNSPYHCIALDPNPSATSCEVTHPHISNEILCEGDGSIIIRSALEEGRICDFYTIVRNILKTYNPDSAYVSLCDWEGLCCYDCGYSVDRDRSYYCCRCHNDYCEECSAYCSWCDETICLGCSVRCSCCEMSYCLSCMGRCRDCESTVCLHCLENDLCPTCIEERNEDEEDENIEENTESPVSNGIFELVGTEVLPDSVGEAIILARQNRQ